MMECEKKYLKREFNRAFTSVLTNSENIYFYHGATNNVRLHLFWIAKLNLISSNDLNVRAHSVRLEIFCKCIFSSFCFLSFT